MNQKTKKHKNPFLSKFFFLGEHYILREVEIVASRVDRGADRRVARGLRF